MKTDEIQLLYEYNYWADRRVLTTSAKVSPEQYVAPANFGLGYGSLRATLVHALDAERQWRVICQGLFNTLPPDGHNATTELTEAALPTLTVLQQRWDTEEKEMRAYLGTLSDEKLNGILRYTVPSGVVRERVLWHCLVHLVNHGTQHRSEAAALLTSYGQSPGDLDFTLFLNEHLSLPC